MSRNISYLVKSLRNSPYFKITGPERAVLQVLADMANDKNGCWPSHQTIAEACSYHVMTVMRALKALVEMGIITIRHRFDQGHQLTNYYTIFPDRIKTIIEFTLKNKSTNTVNKSVDNPVNNTQPIDCSRGNSKIDESSNHSNYIINNHNETSLRKMLIAELMQLRVYKGEIVNLISRYGVQKIYQMKRKIEDLIKSSKLFVGNFGAYLRKCLQNEENPILKPLKIAIGDKFLTNNYTPTVSIEKRESPKEFKDIGLMLRNMVPAVS